MEKKDAIKTSNVVLKNESVLFFFIGCSLLILIQIILNKTNMYKIHVGMLVRDKLFLTHNIASIIRANLK